MSDVTYKISKFLGDKKRFVSENSKRNINEAEDKQENLKYVLDESNWWDVNEKENGDIELTLSAFDLELMKIDIPANEREQDPEVLETADESTLKKFAEILDKKVGGED
mgnify:CR=1 FL=1